MKVVKCSRASYDSRFHSTFPFSISPHFQINIRLILARGSLAILQLIQVPSTNLHIPPILIQALGEALRVRLAATSSPAVALVSSVLALRRYRIVSLLGFGWGTARPTTEEATDGVAYAGANCYTTVD